MNIKLYGLIFSLLTTSLMGCGSKTNYEPGDLLTLTSIEMSDEYGESTLIQYGSYDIVIDSGSRDDANHVEEVLKNKINDNTIDLLVVTHPHGDHIGGIIAGALDDFKVNQIVDYGYTYNTSGTDHISNSSYVNQYITKRNSWVNSGATYHSVLTQMMTGKTLEIDKDNDLTLRWLKNDYYYDDIFPNSSCGSDNPNTTSVSFVLEYKYWNIVMCGDIDTTYGEKSIIANHKKLFKDENKRVLLKATHHASSTSMGYDFLDWTRPEMMFISTAMLDSACAPNQVVLGSGDGQQNHPNSSTVRRIKKTTTNVYWNGINGDITFTTDGVNDMTMVGACRSKNYYEKGTTNIVDAVSEKQTKFFDSKFYQYYK